MESFAQIRAVANEANAALRFNRNLHSSSQQPPRGTFKTADALELPDLKGLG